MADNFTAACSQGLKRLNLSHVSLKKEQEKALKAVVVQRKDCLAVLPTGFGKSLVFQLIPFVADILIESSDSLVLVVTPLNAIISDQIQKLERIGVEVVVFKQDSRLNPPDIPMPSSKVKFIYGHPEAFLEQQTKKLFRNKTFQRRLKAIVVDEAHFIIQWKDFRPAYTKLNLLGTFFPKVPFLALTATATSQDRREIQNSLGMNDTCVVDANPNRSNIFYSVSTRDNRGEGKVIDIIRPIALELQKKLVATPLTIIYSNLETCGDCYQYFDKVLGCSQYYPPESEPRFKNRLFAQYHAEYPDCYRECLIKDIILGASVARVLFVTVAFGVGIDVPTVERVIHIGVPCTMEEFFQETGRAGRDGKPASSTVFFNSYDISKSRQALQPVMREYVTTSACRREIILQYFGATKPVTSSDLHTCCDNCRKSCKCSDCLKHDEAEHAASDKGLATKLPGGSNSKYAGLSCIQTFHLKHELLSYRDSLLTESSNIGISLTTGFSLQLVDSVLEMFSSLNCKDDVELCLPVFDKQHTEKIWQIVEKYK